MTIKMQPYFSALLLHHDSSHGTAATYSVIRELTPDQYKRYATAYEVVNNVLNVNVFTYMKWALQEYISTIQKDVEEFLSGQLRIGEQDDIVRVGIRMRSAVLAFCSALHFHQEHIYKEVFRIHGENSPAHRKVRKAFNRLFEKSFEYRLLYHTRNTMVHHTMETVVIWVQSFMVNGEQKAMSDPRIDLSAIIELNDEVPENFKVQLRKIDDNPSVTELIGAAFPLVRETNERLLRYLYPNIDEACEVIREFDDLFEGREGIRGLSTERSANNPPPLKFSHQTWARNVLEYAREQAK